MSENIQLNQEPISQQWLDYCQELEDKKFADVYGLANADLYSEQSIIDLGRAVRLNYSGADTVPDDVREAHEAYLGQYVVHNSGGKWIQITQPEHNISHRAILVDGSNGFSIPAELWKLLFIPELSDALLAALKQ